jgi:hypothetical protein
MSAQGDSCHDAATDAVRARINDEYDVRGWPSHVCEDIAGSMDSARAVVVRAQAFGGGLR